MYTCQGRKATKGFADEERAAMKKRVQELKASARRCRSAGKAYGESDFVLTKIRPSHYDWLFDPRQRV